MTQIYKQILSLSVNSEVSSGNFSVNVLEACWEETIKGKPTYNVLAGVALIKMLEHVRPTNNVAFKSAILPEGAKLDGDTYDVLPDLRVNNVEKRANEFNISKDWMDLYNTWNMFFVSNKLDSQFLPIKLLIPSVLDAKPEQFVESRGFSLFLIGNLFHQNKLSVFPQKTTLLKEKDILQEWGKINKDYANFVLGTHCPDLEGMPLEDIFKDIFGDHPNVSMLMHLKNFVTNRANFQITTETGVTPSSPGPDSA